MRLVISILSLLSMLPLPLLYALATGLRFVLQYLLKYRKRVIDENLKHAFPEKTQFERRKIADDYYKFLADLVVETIKLRSMSAKELQKRCNIENPALLGELLNNGKNVIIMMGHSGNWEWAGNYTAMQYGVTTLPVYRKVKQDDFNAFFLKIRSRFGPVPVTDKEAFNEIRKQASPHMVALLADQVPATRKGIWVSFLKQPTIFYRGTEVLVNRLGYKVLFAHIRHVSKGRYSIVFEAAPDKVKGNGITVAFAGFLERHIEQQPHNWLWSHKRWKHRPPPKVELTDPHRNIKSIPPL